MKGTIELEAEEWERQRKLAESAKSKREAPTDASATDSDDAVLRDLGRKLGHGGRALETFVEGRPVRGRVRS